MTDVTHRTRKILIVPVFPPIPTRSYDWQAYFDGEEEDGPKGWGETERDALEDLLVEWKLAK